MRTSQIIFEYDLNRFDLAFQAWGQGDPEVLARFNRVEQERLAWLRRIFRELGFKGADLEMRVRTFLGYHSWERSRSLPPSKAQAQQQIKRRIEFFLRP